MREYNVEIPFRYLRWAITLLCVWSLLVVSEARAGNTDSVGSSTTGSISQFEECPTDHWFIGLEVKYGLVGLRKVRFACTKLAENGSWVGAKRFTNWSNNNTTETEIVKSGYCPNGYVVNGFRARTSGSNIRALIVYCRKVGADGLQSQTSGSSGWLGVKKGDYSNTNYCPSGEAARRFDMRSASMLTYFRMSCQTIEVQEEGMRDVTIPGLTIYNLAKNFGFQFTARYGGSTNTNCRMKVKGGKLRIETTPATPIGKGCRFDFFADGPNLKNDWQLRSVRIRSFDTGGCGRRRFSNPITPTFDLEFVYEMERGRNPGGLCISFLESVTLRGPSSQSWQDAF